MTLLRGAVWCASLAAFSGFGVAQSLAGQTPGLLSPEHVGRAGEPPTRYGRAIALVMLRERTAIAVTATGSEIVEVARRDRTTATWTIRSHKVGMESVRPLVALGPNGHITAAWVVGGRVVISSRDPVRGRWSDAEALSEGGVTAVRLATSIDGDTLVAWVRDDRLYTRLRPAGVPRFGGTQAVTAEPARLSLSESALLIDTFGEGAIAWSEQPTSDRSNARQVLRVALRAAGNDSIWGAPELLPIGRAAAVALPPVVGADAAGTITAAWIEEGLAKSADRTTSGAEWTLAQGSVFASPPDLTSVALTIEPSGRAVMAAIEQVSPTLSAVRIAARDGSADRWSEAGVSPAKRSTGKDSLAISTTALGDALVVHGRAGDDCRGTVTVLASGASRRGDAADMAGVCDSVSIVVDQTGDAIVAGVGSDKTLQAALRPVAGLVLDLESGAAGRIRIRASAPSSVLLTVRRAGRVVARRTAFATTDWRTVPIAGTGAPGRYQVSARATSGSAASAIETLPLRR